VKEGLHALADLWRSLSHVAESVWNDWQVGVLLIGASVGWHFTADRTHPLAKVVSRALGNAAMGLAFVLLLLLAVNLVDPSGHQETLSRVDRFLLAVHEALPRWLKVPWLALPLMLVLAALTVAFPQWRLVSRFVRARKLSSRALAVLGVVASFTFFTDHGVLAPRERGITVHLETRLRESREREEKTVGRFLALKAVAESVQSLPPQDAARLRAFFRDLSSATPDRRFADMVARARGRLLYQELLASPANTSVPPPDGPVVPRVITKATDLPGLLETQKAAEDQAQARKKELELAITESLKQTLDLGTGPVTEIVTEFFAGLVTEAAPDLRDAVKEIMGKAADAYVTKYADGLIEKLAVRFRPMLEQLSSNAAGYLGAVRGDIAAMEHAQEFVVQSRSRELDAGQRAALLQREAANVQRAAKLAELASLDNPGPYRDWALEVDRALIRLRAGPRIAGEPAGRPGRDNDDKGTDDPRIIERTVIPAPRAPLRGR